MTRIGYLAGLNASLMLPPVVRYLDEQWVDEFMDHGSLRLTSFQRCAKHDDDQRKDGREGRLSLQARDPAGSTLAAVVTPSPTFYVLCCSTALDKRLRDLFQVSSGFLIRDPMVFSTEVAIALANCRAIAHGPCFYCPESARLMTTDSPVLLQPPRQEEDMEKIPALIRKLDNLRSIFTKPIEPFMEQHEYRFLWDIGRDVNDYVDITAPAAAAVCEKVDFRTEDDQPDSSP